MKTDTFLLADVFENFINVSTKDYGISPLCSVSICNYTLQCCVKCTKIKLQTLQDKDMILLIERKICGGGSSVLGDRYVKSDESNKIIC